MGHAHTSSRALGPTVVFAIPAIFAVVWFFRVPAELTFAESIGDLLGVEGLILLSMGLLLSSHLPWVEVLFDGIDRAAIWHRWLAVGGLALLLPHPLLSNIAHAPWWGHLLAQISYWGLWVTAVWSTVPRLRTKLPAKAQRGVEWAAGFRPFGLLLEVLEHYDLWRMVHRVSALLVIAGFGHGIVAGRQGSLADPVLYRSYLLLVGAGIAAWAYREIFARHGHRRHDYEVESTTRIAPGLTEIRLRPVGAPLVYLPGQFAMMHVAWGRGFGLRRHPFTLASSPADPYLSVTVKALGDFTSSVARSIAPGTRALISGPHGRFTHTKAIGRQIWVAGGVGVTPFLSWVRALDDHPPRGRVDFFYSVRDIAPYLEEITETLERHPSVRLHLWRSDLQGRLDAERILSESGTKPHYLSVFMCGPEQMLSRLGRDLVTLGVPASRLHREYFTWR